MRGSQEWGNLCRAPTGWAAQESGDPEAAWVGFSHSQTHPPNPSYSEASSLPTCQHRLSPTCPSPAYPQSFRPGRGGRTSVPAGDRALERCGCRKGKGIGVPRGHRKRGWNPPEAGFLSLPPLFSPQAPTHRAREGRATSALKKSWFCSFKKNIQRRIRGMKKIL